MGDRPTHFEIPVDDPDRAERFYADAFGWSFNRFPGAPSYYGLAATGDSVPGIDGALYQRGEQNETMLTMSVESIEEAGDRILAAGGQIVSPKAPVPGVGWFAQFKDTEGNTIGIFLSDESASM